MSTRSNLVIKDEGKQLVRIYRQCDGYPSGMGDDIKAALNNGDVRIVNGFSGGDVIPKSFNGMGCLAAYIIGALKGDKIGNVYIDAAKSPYAGIEWEYTLTEKKGEVWLEVVDVYAKKSVYVGSLKNFDGERIEKELQEVQS